MTLRERLAVYVVALLSVGAGYRLTQWHTWVQEYSLEEQTERALTRIMSTDIKRTKALYRRAKAISSTVWYMPEEDTTRGLQQIDVQSR